EPLQYPALAAVREIHRFEAYLAAADTQVRRVRCIYHLVRQRQRIDAVLYGADLLEQRGHLPHDPVRDTVEAQGHRRHRRDAADADIALGPQPKPDAAAADDEQHAEDVIDDFDRRHQPHLPVYHLQEL